MDSFERLQETWQDKIFYVSQTFHFTFATVRASGINFPSLVRIHSFAQSRENKFISMVLFILDRELILFKQFCNNVLISLTGFLRISTNLARIESSSRNFSQHAGYVTVSIRMHQNARYIRVVFRREAVAAKNQLRWWIMRSVYRGERSDYIRGIRQSRR